MERWAGRVAAVTGAGSGIGAAMAYQLQDAGVTVVGLDIFEERIPGAVEQARKDAIARGRVSRGKASSPGKLHSIKCDVSKEEDILKTFEWIRENVGGVDILVNNAGVPAYTSLTSKDRNTAEWKRVLDVNVLGLSLCIREAVLQMRERGVDDGHIVNVGSVCGHINPIWSNFAVFHSSKHAVRVLTEGLRKELVEARSRIRVTELSPGVVRTNIPVNTRGKTVEEFYQEHPYLNPEDLADALLYALSVPPHVQIHEMIVKPIGEAF